MVVTISTLILIGGRQPDTIVPDLGDPQSLNRYSYTLNNPVRYTDPTGMFSEDEIMAYLGVTTWDEVLAMFGVGGTMAGRWGYLEVLRQAQLGTPISMWFDVGTGYQFNIHQPNMIGSFSKMNGALVFSGAFIDWSGSGGSWTVGGISAVAASTLLGSNGAYQLGLSNNYIGAVNQYSHLKFDSSRIDPVDLQLALISTGGDIGIAFVAVGAAHGDIPLVAAGGALVVGKVSADAAAIGRSYQQYKNGDQSLTAMAVDVSLTLGGYTPYGIYFDVVDLTLLASEGIVATP